VGAQKDLPVVIRADRLTPYESVVRAMDATAQLGLAKMSLATNETESAAE
jgi:biopolymer transport protein ExbD